MSKQLPTDYQQFIATSKYARWLDDVGRRETWTETVDRYCDYIFGKCPQIPQQDRDEVREAILNLDVMPSMRTLMAAGKAADKSSVCNFNCAYMPINNVKAFDEALYILACGTGLGYSVERQYVAKLPEIPDELFDSETTIVVKDSRAGWAKAYRQLISLLYAGEIPKWDVSQVRPAGERLKTMGGRASGPGPLVDLFYHTIDVFRHAVGRRLSSIECHSILCKIGQVIIAGSVRRSALLSLSNLSDDRMRFAKSGNWWIENGHFSLANNSVAYTEKPEAETFLREWTALVESKSGERGIFNRQAAVRQVKANGRRSENYEFGCNPCSFTGDMRILTVDGEKRFDELVNQPNVKIIDYEGNESLTTIWSVGERETIYVHLDNGQVITCTPDHVFMLEDGSECPASELSGKTLRSQHSTESLIMNPTVLGIEEKGLAEVFDFEEPNTNWAIVEGVVVHNSEIILRPQGFCNLSEVVARHTDTYEDLERKVRIASIIGTIQSTFTDFPYLRRVWRHNAEEERLLGVSITGIMDCPLLNVPGPELQERLSKLKNIAIEVNSDYAARLGINESVAITCVKPAGTTSQLTNSASGIHSRYSKYYVRTVRGNNNDPLTKFMTDIGVPSEPDVMNADNTTVFSFPVKSPDNSITRDDMTAIEQLEMWMLYKKYWCEHKPSVTISVRDHEWPEVGAWVYNNFDDICGISFLPHSDHTYQQAPYQEITEEEYEQWVAKMPESIDWTKLSDFEKEDHTTGSQELACTGNVCEIVDIGS